MKIKLIYIMIKRSMSIGSLSNKYKVRKCVINYLTALIDKHGIDILRTSKNKIHIKNGKQVNVCQTFHYLNLYVNIDVKINDNYLSDIIKEGNIADELKELYDNLKKIENYIIKNQKFELSDKLKNVRTYNFLNNNFSKIRELEENMSSF